MGKAVSELQDRIEIKDLLVRAIIGIKPAERTDRQDVLINLVLWTDLRAPGRSDDIGEAVNYRSVTKDVLALVEGSDHHTVEKLATEIASLVLARYPVTEVTVGVEKPGALRFARSVGVTITRNRSDLGT
jgi:FolB domain-containing protein